MKINPPEQFEFVYLYLFFNYHVHCVMKCIFNMWKVQHGVSFVGSAREDGLDRRPDHSRPLCRTDVPPRGAPTALPAVRSSSTSEGLHQQSELTPAVAGRVTVVRGTRVGLHAWRTDCGGVRQGALPLDRRGQGLLLTDFTGFIAGLASFILGSLLEMRTGWSVRAGLVNKSDKQVQYLLLRGPLKRGINLIKCGFGAAPAKILTIFSTV